MPSTLELEIKRIANLFLEDIKKEEVVVVSHFDADGISSATIIIQTLKRLDKKFILKIVKSLEENFIKSLPKDKIILFIDLGSNSLDKIKEAGFKGVYIIDHHEIQEIVPKEIKIINPQLNGKEKISSSGLVYLFSKEINHENKNLAKISIIGMVGDRLEKEISKLNHNILEDAEIVRKRGLLIYPSTRPLNHVLEFSHNPYIDGITGNMKGTLEFLRENNIKCVNGKYPTILELNEKETENLITNIFLKVSKENRKNLVGDIFLIKWYNQLEDVREICAKINACSRLGEVGTAIQFCMEIVDAKKKAHKIHSKYKQEIISGLKTLHEINSIKGDKYVIIPAKNKIKDTIIGTLASIISNSQKYDEETTIITMAYYQDKIKISARNVGDKGRNVREILSEAIKPIGCGEFGGHEFAAGGIIYQKDENKFIENLKKILEIETIKI